MKNFRLHRFLQWVERELCAVLAVGIVGLGSIWAMAGTSGTATLSVTILPPGGEVISVTTPNGGESWTVGTSQSITWTATVTITDVKIELQRSVGGAWETIVASTTNDGTYSWTVAGSATTAANIRISKVGDASVNDVSNAIFSIVAAGGGGGGGITQPVPQPVAPPVVEVWQASDYRARVIQQTYALVLLPEEEATITIRLLNTGRATWYGNGVSNPIRLGVVGDDPSTLSADAWIKFNRAAAIESNDVLGAVQPKEEGWFTLKIQAPLKPGVYREQFAVVAEYLTWLSNTKVNVKVTVPAPKVIAKKTSSKVTPTTPTTPKTIKGTVPQKEGWLATVWHWILNKAVAAVKAATTH